MTTQAQQLDRGGLLRVLLRSFTLQASWNFEGLQSLGFLYAMAPALRRLYSGEALRAAFARHLEYFNTHPFLASSVLGTALALEEKRPGAQVEPLDAEEFKGMVMAPYAAMGDALFWGGVRPLAAGVAVFCALRGYWWAPLIFLVLFNLPHLWFRTVGLWRGYRLGLGAVSLLQGRHLPDLAVRCKELTVVVLGALCALLAYVALRGEALPLLWGGAAIPLVALLGWLARRGLSPLLLTMSLATLILAVYRYHP